jgi:hypothetical protein
MTSSSDYSQEVAVDVVSGPKMGLEALEIALEVVEDIVEMISSCEFPIARGVYELVYVDDRIPRMLRGKVDDQVGECETLDDA